MIRLLIVLVHNLAVLLIRMAFWPVWLVTRLRPMTLRIDVPPHPARRPAGRLARMLGLGEADLETIHDLVGVVRRDPMFRGIVVTVPAGGLSRSDAVDLREALGTVVEAGKAVTVVLREGGGLGEIRIAPPGSRIVVHPAAVLRLEGAAAMPLAIGDMLARLGVRADLEAVGEYKTAPEMFTRPDISDRNRLQIRSLLEDVDSALVGDVAATRRVGADAVRSWIAEKVLTPAEACRHGAVDAVGLDEEAEAYAGGPSRVVLPSDLPARLRIRWRHRPWRRPVVVGVVSIRGQILSRPPGPQPGVAAVASAVAPVVERAGRDPAIRAIVLDIDSRGGSALGADAIYRRARAAAGLKPVVARLREVAASGGYYIAAAAHEIVALPDTITGSIGVFGGKIAADGLLGKLGVAAERVTAIDPAAGIMLPDRPFTDEERALVRKEMRAVYDVFLGIVADRKGKSPAEVEPAAGGRVLSGSRALGHDLVDRLGGRRALVEALAARLRCPPDRIALRHLDRPSPLGFLEPSRWIDASLARALATARLVAAERVVAELPLDLSAEEC